MDRVILEEKLTELSDRLDIRVEGGGEELIFLGLSLELLCDY